MDLSQNKDAVYWRSYYLKNREKLLEQHEIRRKRYRKVLKVQIFNLLGNTCSNPYNLPHPDWCNDLEILQIDHVHSDGWKDRRKERLAYYKKVLKEIQSGSKDYQLLCPNCNWKKKVLNKENRSNSFRRSEQI